MKAKLAFDVVSDPEAVLAIVEGLDPGVVGCTARLAITAEAVVNDSRPVHGKREAFTHAFRISGERQVIAIPRSRSMPYSYDGRHVDVVLKAELRIDDGVLFDTKIKAQIEVEPPARPGATLCAKHVVEPPDRYRFWANWLAIPARNKAAALVLGLVGAIVGAVNTALGVHDQFAPEGQTYLYSHRDSDGDAQSPLLSSGAVTGGAALVVWFALRRQLRTYMTFQADSRPVARLGRDTEAVVGELFHGVARVPLRNVVLRIVACNMERGQYVRGSGSSRRTVSFKEPVRGLVLYEKQTAEIPAGVPVESFFPDTVSFAPLFDSLYPPLSVTNDHGVDVYWEIQLLHDEYVDQELVGDVSGLAVADFHAPRSAAVEPVSTPPEPSLPMPIDAPLPDDFQ
ncbi:MAG: hypothetical protein KF688_16270 [Pirellulales bacterium]|nr:hypothetical protein [Pirellulales bacterium]